jgi:hypothetical protein
MNKISISVLNVILLLLHLFLIISIFLSKFAETKNLGLGIIIFIFIVINFLVCFFKNYSRILLLTFDTVVLLLHFILLIKIFPSIKLEIFQYSDRVFVLFIFVIYPILISLLSIFFYTRPNVVKYFK